MKVDKIPKKNGAIQRKAPKKIKKLPRPKKISPQQARRRMIKALDILWSQRVKEMRGGVCASCGLAERTPTTTLSGEAVMRCDGT